MKHKSADISQVRASVSMKAFLVVDEVMQFKGEDEWYFTSEAYEQLKKRTAYEYDGNGIGTEMQHCKSIQN